MTNPHPPLYTSTIHQWHAVKLTTEEFHPLLNALENGEVVFFPQLAFTLQANESSLISPQWSDGKSKNISFNSHKNKLQGFKGDAIQREAMQNLMARYANTTYHWLQQLLPLYASHLEIGRTSFRPIEVAGRQAPSYRKDDTRLHVDAFPASPNQGKRILRVFSNMNLQQPRCWRLGEPFETVARYFLPQIPKPLPGSASLLKKLKITRGLRTRYDHYMLQIHDRMKGDMTYQTQAQSFNVEFPAQTTWMVFTDQASHAALAGQYVLEQTFYLPVSAMAKPEKSPLRILERLLVKSLN